MTAPTPAELADRLEALAKEATPGPWDRDTERSDGEYGLGPDTSSGFHVSTICASDGKTLFDAHNSDACIVNEEFDEDGFCYAWDEVSDANGALIVELRNNLPTILASLRAVEGWQEIERRAYENAAECQPCTAEDPNESAYQRGRFDGVMEFAKAIRALATSEAPDTGEG